MGDNENQPMDRDARTEAASAMFDGEAVIEKPADAGAQPGAEATGDQPAGDGAQPGAETQPVEGQLTDDQRQADPAFQELSGFKDEVVNALSEAGIPLDDKGNPDLKEAGLQLSDAAVLYKIMRGEGTPSALLDVMAQNAGWTDQQKQFVAQDLIGWLQKSGYLKGDAASGGRPAAGGAKDPLVDRLDKLEGDRKTEAERAEQAKVVAHQEKVFTEKFLPNVQKLCDQKRIPKDDFPFFAEKIAGSINGNKTILARIEAGNFVDVQRLFSQIYNAEIARIQRYTKAQTAAADKKIAQNPRIPAGGAPPRPAGAERNRPMTRDERIAAATEQL